MKAMPNEVKIRVRVCRLFVRLLICWSLTALDGDNECETKATRTQCDASDESISMASPPSRPAVGPLCASGNLFSLFNRISCVRMVRGRARVREAASRVCVFALCRLWPGISSPQAEWRHSNPFAVQRAQIALCGARTNVHHGSFGGERPRDEYHCDLETFSNVKRNSFSAFVALTCDLTHRSAIKTRTKARPRHREPLASAWSRRKAKQKWKRARETRGKAAKRASAMEHHQQYDRLRPDKLQSSEYFVLMLAMR